MKTPKKLKMAFITWICIYPLMENQLNWCYSLNGYIATKKCHKDAAGKQNSDQFSFSLKDIHSSNSQRSNSRKVNVSQYFNYFMPITPSSGNRVPIIKR